MLFVAADVVGLVCNAQADTLHTYTLLHVLHEQSLFLSTGANKFTSIIAKGLVFGVFIKTGKIVKALLLEFLSRLVIVLLSLSVS